MCCTCIACAFGLFFGFSQMMVLEVQHSRYGGIYRLDSYSQYRIVLSSDSSVTRNKKSLIRGRLVSGGTADGNSGTLCGSVLVISSSLEAYCWGQHLLITAPLSEAPKTDKAAPSREIHYISYANQDEIREEGWNNTFYEIRAALLEQLRHCCRALSPETEGFLLALLLGIRDRLPAHVREFFVLSGCMHILALSGMHLGILVSGLVFLTANIFGRRVSGICGICFTAFYLFLVGLKPSLLRAAIMFFLASTARTCGKRSSACALLSLTFLISAWCFTRDLFSLSFQFSYAALAGIIVLGKRLYFLIRGSLPPVIASPLCAAVAAQSATAFLAVGSFGSLYPVGIIAAILLTPLIVVFICEGILFLIISITGLPWLIRIVNDIIEWTFFLIRTTVSFFSQCPFLSIPERYAFLIFLIPVIMVCYLYIFPNGTVKRQTDD
jgi:ComEC/Rec2-related protein